MCPDNRGSTVVTVKPPVAKGQSNNGHNDSLTTKEWILYKWFAPKCPLLRPTVGPSDSTKLTAGI